MSIATVEDRKAIEETLARYVQGCSISGDVTKKEFHSSATVNAEPAQVLFDLIDSKEPTKYIAQIDVFDVFGDMATARVVMEGQNGVGFVDFHHLLRTDEGWKIVSKIYQKI